MGWQRPDGRDPQELRSHRFQRHFTQFPLGSVLAQAEQTHVLCTVSVREGVPKFLEGSGRGWLTAEYRMLPGATRQRQEREVLTLSGRTQEIQRLIGRSLRAALDFSRLGERTLIVDADVLQADAGTRSVAITGGYIALVDAVNQLVKTGVLAESPLIQQVAAVSVGLIDGTAYLDLTYAEDVAASVDFNVVMTSDGQFLEVQGTAEAGVFSRSDLNTMLDAAAHGIHQLVLAQQQALAEHYD
ncbi:ribonuclease PH [Parathermosynechococcus lividus]|nr:ribonuclease PH [Synechococcus sp. PCC 6716]